MHPPSAPAKDPLASLPDIPPLPGKLVEKILAWEYTDLSELLPDQLRAYDSPASNQDAKIVLLPQQTWETQRRKRRQIIDIASWIHVYSTYMLIISSRFPEALPDLIAYQLLIVKQAKRFRYPSWLYYDIEFRKWAAATKTKEWAHINSEIYTLAFTGQGL